MSEKRFDFNLGACKIYDKQEERLLEDTEVCGLLNEQQSEINSLKIGLELSSGEKLFSRRELERKVDEQQATIRKLQDLCGESDGENAKLKIENKRLQEELNDCEKFRYQVFKRLNDEHIKECSIK